MNTTNTPFLEVVDGWGGRLELPRGLSLVGRDEGAELRLPSPEVSVQHAWIRRDGRAVWVRDANSTNGTRLNGRRLDRDHEQELNDRDTLEFGPVRVVFHDPARGPAARGTRVAHRPPSGVSYGDVSAGNFNNAGRDIHNNYDNRQHHRYEVTTPEGEVLNELATGRGAGRVVMILGQLMVLAGFAIWVGVIFRFILAGTRAASGPEPNFGPPTEFLGPEVFDGIPLGVVGFTTFGLGLVVTSIGTIMAKSARERRGRRDE